MAILNGISESELRLSILQDKNFLKEAREKLLAINLEIGERTTELLDKKAVADFYYTYAENHFNEWSKFLATDYSHSMEHILYTSAVKGHIGANKDFWQTATKEIKAGFKASLNDDITFLRMFFDVVEGVEFKLGIHHQAIFNELNNILNGNVDVLIINLPPRVGKSTTLYAWASKILLTQKNSNIIYGSYGEVVLTLIRKRIDRALAKTRIDKDEINPLYEIFNVTKADGFDKESDFITTIGSSFFSATLLGGITGRGYSVFSEANGAMILDDPNNPNDVGTARMETIQEKFDTTWNSRRGKNPLIITMQRVADNDLTGHILNLFRDTEETNIKVLTLPLIMCEEVASYVAKKQQEYPKVDFIDPSKYMKIGDSLLPMRDIIKIKDSTHPSVFNTQYLQIPTSFEGVLFKKKMFYNKVINVEAIRNKNNDAIGYVHVDCLDRKNINDDFVETKISFEGVFILHIDTTSGNTATKGKNVDDCIWSIMVGGLKGRAKNSDNYYGAVLEQYSLNSKYASVEVMENKTLEIIKAINDFYDKNVKPIIFITIEAHAQGGGLASFLKGLNMPNCYVYSYNRQNYGDKKQRFINGAGYYEQRIFWYQEDAPLFSLYNKDSQIIKTNDWFYASRFQHLSFEVDNTSLHDDYIEAVCDLCNLWIADNKRDIFYKTYMEWRTQHANA